MWYRVDFLKLAVQLTPPVLRCGLTVALLKAMTVPIRYVYDRFTEYRGYVSGRLDTTANVISIEGALNAAFHLDGRQIRIETTDGDPASYWRYGREGKASPAMYYKGGGKGLTLRHEKEASYKPSFTVWVPSFLCTSLDAEEDKYGGEHLRTIKTLTDYYKPAGHSMYRIKTYDYE